LSLARRVDGVATPTAPHAIRSRVTDAPHTRSSGHLTTPVSNLAGMLLLLALSTTIVRPTLEFTSRRASLHRSAAAGPLVHRVEMSADGTQVCSSAADETLCFWIVWDSKPKKKSKSSVAAPKRPSIMHTLR